MAERNTHMKDGELIAVGLEEAVKVEAGKMGAVNAAGYLVEAADSAGLIVIGRIEETVDNTDGSDGDVSAKVRRKKAFKWNNSTENAVTQAHVGNDVFVEDDETVASDAGTNKIVAGVCLAVDTDGVWVEPGHRNVAANQADSTAENVAGIVSDFNDLLAALQTAGLMK